MLIHNHTIIPVILPMSHEYPTMIPIKNDYPTIILKKNKWDNHY